MSQLQDIIASSSIKAFNHGIQAERERIIKLLEDSLGKVTPEALIKIIRGEQA